VIEPIEIDPKTFLRKHCTLPAMPSVVNEIQQEIYREDADMQRVAALINGEPSLTAQIFKIVNSAYYGLPREIAQVQMAIGFLGLNEVYRLVLSLSVINTLEIKSQEEIRAFWFHSFYTAVCTKHLARKYEPYLPYEELWSAGLLHDIGKLVYLKFFPEHYSALCRLSQDEGIFFCDAERQLTFPASAYLGTLLCEYWRLPQEINQACEFHTLRDLQAVTGEGDMTPLQRMICLGNMVALLSDNNLGDPAKEELTGTLCENLKCSEDEFLNLMTDIYALRAEAESFMQNIS
jgi:HD-like signal output (HDOD) protein